MRMHLIENPALVFAWVALTLIASVASAEFHVLQIAPGVYSGPAPAEDEEYCQLQHLGVRTILDMRKRAPDASDREEDIARSRGMLYRHIPLGFLPTRTYAPEKVLQLMSDARFHPIYVHCNLGRDRTGLIVALYRVRCLGWNPQRAYAAMQQQRFNPLLRDLDRYYWQNVGR